MQKFWNNFQGYCAISFRLGNIWILLTLMNSFFELHMNLLWMDLHGQANSGMYSLLRQCFLYNQKLLVYICRFVKCVNGFVFQLWSSGGEWAKEDWAISAPPAVDPLNQAAHLHQAEQQLSKNINLSSHKAPHLSYFHNCQRLRNARPSQHILPGKVWRGVFVWTVYQRSFISVCCRKYQGAISRWDPLRIWAPLSALDRKRCQILLIRWNCKASKVSLPN